MSPLRRAAASLKDSYRSGGRAAISATGGTISGGGASPAPEASSGPPSWATAMKRSEEHTSELQSLMRISYAVFCLKKKNKTEARITAKTKLAKTTTTTQEYVYNKTH